MSALRAWMEDDYGDGAISLTFYGGEISEDQKRVAKRTRQLVERKVGRFSSLRELVGNKAIAETEPVQARRAGALFTRPLSLQWVVGTPEVAETSFFKINSQGTPLDDTETMLIENRRKPIAISARAILRAGAGHKYWSGFTDENRQQIEGLAGDLYRLMFEPEVATPIKTLDVPLGGSVSPVDALSLLIEYLTIAGEKNQAAIRIISDYADDADGGETIEVLRRSLEIANWITGNSAKSLGLHPAVYFYNEKGKHSRFLFLGMTALIAEKIRNNDGAWFKKFSSARPKVEQFLIENKSLLGIVLQNLSKAQRIPKVRDLFSFLVAEANAGKIVKAEAAVAHLGLRGRILDVTAIQTAPHFTDDTKSMVFMRQAIEAALKCPICKGLLDPAKSVSYDHKVKRKDGGTGDATNAQLVHPYCNSAVKG